VGAPSLPANAPARVYDLLARAEQQFWANPPPRSPREATRIGEWMDETADYIERMCDLAKDPFNEMRPLWA
jgi:hypothetical protein